MFLYSTQRHKDAKIQRDEKRFLTFSSLRLCVFLILLLVLTGCHRTVLTVQNIFITPSWYASSVVGSPDASEDCYLEGQRLYIHWNLIKNYCPQSEYEIVLDVRFNDLSYAAEHYIVDKKMGYVVFELLGDVYFEKEGILSYRAVLFQDGQELAAFQHQLFVELLQLNQ